MSKVFVIALVLAVSGCGGDDEAPTTASPPRESASTETQTATADAPSTDTDRTETQTESAPSDSPEDQPGGAGDEEPARTLALFTADGGRIAPRVVRVPAFISIQVELRSKDGARYGLLFGDVMVTAGGEVNSLSTTLDGLRPGEAIVGKPTAAGNRVRIEATAEPGP